MTFQLLRGCAASCACLVLVAAQARTQEASNASIVRKISGAHTCTLLADGAPCGGEVFIHTVQPDGTRTLRAFTDWVSGKGQITLVLRATEDFTMREAFAQVYSEGKNFGTGYYVVTDSAVEATVNGPEGVFTHSDPLPETYSLLLHPVSADSWHFSRYDKTQGGEQTVAIYTLGGAGRSVLGAFFPIALRFIADETITVPAGTFETEHYKFGKDADVWFMGPDRIVVRHEYTVNGTRYELTELTTTE